FQNEQERRQAAITRKLEARSVMVTRDPAWERERVLAELDRAIDSGKTSLVGTAAAISSSFQGRSIKEIADDAELGAEAGGVSAAAALAAGAGTSRQELESYRGSAGRTPRRDVEHQPRPRTQSKITDSDRSVTDENRGLVSAKDPALGLPRRA